MRARVVVFPIKGKNWCFSRSVDPKAREALSSNIPSTFAELWERISKPAMDKPSWSNLELAIDFAANKAILHPILWLLSGVKPSEIFLKSITKEVNRVEITYPSRGTNIHKKYLYGSASLLPLTMVLMVLPTPNIPFFWILFRTYSHWRALKGSEKLLQLVPDCQDNQKSSENTINKNRSTEVDSRKYCNSQDPTWELSPSDELQKLVCHDDATDGLSESTVDAICQKYNLIKRDVNTSLHFALIS